MQSPDTPQCIWLIDASIYVFRPWYAWSNTHKNEAGQCINAALGFIDFVDDLLANEKPIHIGFAFDESLISSHRKDILPNYKANRKSASENLRFQFTLCRRYIRALGITEASSPYYEGDDVLATWARHYQREHNAQIVKVITGDKDLVQLVGESDLWCDYSKQISLDYKGVIKKFGVRPDQVADQLALAGDKSDNIPGVPGIGMAVAAKLLRHFDNIETMLNSIERIGKMKFLGAMKVQLLVEEYQQQIKQCRRVTSLITDVPDIEMDISRKLVNKDEVEQLFIELGKTV
ncbi:MAG: 5'-3' exonuclease H3TH domain-containing protein [Methylococcaceae bacterium]